jgi:hypothetical protein
LKRNYDEIKAAALVIADQKRRAAEEEYQRATTDLRLPPNSAFPSTRTPELWWDAENAYRVSLAAALDQYERTCEDALLA